MTTFERLHKLPNVRTTRMLSFIAHLQFMVIVNIADR